MITSATSQFPIKFTIMQLATQASYLAIDEHVGCSWSPKSSQVNEAI